jgi:hypothetical protein
MINIYIAIILENYDEAQEQEEIGVTKEDFDHFYSIWEKYDRHATQFIKLELIYDFVSEIGEPLGVKKPNDMAITSFNLPIIKGDLIHCLDILHALSVYKIGTYEDTEEFKKLQVKIDQEFLQHFPVRVRHVSRIYQNYSRPLILKNFISKRHLFRLLWKEKKWN